MTKRETLLMDCDWLFHKGDFPKEKIVEHMYTYDLCKTTRGHGPAAVSFPDSDWRHVRLPHDYVIEGEPSDSENGIKGSLPRPNAWYRRYFRLEPDDAGKRLTLSFEGIATHSVIYLNGHLVYRSFSGYTGFEVDITDFIRTGEELNVLSVYVNNHESEGWWYEGAGIYRHVWLIKTGLVSVDTWGTFVRTKPRADGIWDTVADTELRNDLYEETRGRLVSTVRDELGNIVARGEADFTIEPRGKLVVKQALHAKNPPAWSPDDPNMCYMTSEIFVNGELTDDYLTPFGYRALRYDPDEGFFINGQNLKLKGLCAHQDHGGLGVAVPDSMQEFRVRQMIGAGANALRSTHNPASPSLLDACDRLGMMVMDENRWLVSSESRVKELEDMIKRGRNHPSIILWSVFNEDAILAKPAGAKIFRRLYAHAARLDDTRAIIGAPVKNVDDPDYIGVSPVMGFNYNFDKVDSLHDRWHKPHVNTETHQGNYTGGNDGWRLAVERPWVMGIFCWGVETRGETYWPRLFAPWGIMDGLCYPKVHYELYRNSYWATEPRVKIVPMLDYPRILDVSPCWLNMRKPRRAIGWNHKDFEGKTADVWVYTNAKSVELYLNGVSLGAKPADPFEQVCWQVPYRSGELLAVARDDAGREVARDVLRSTGEPVSLQYEVHNEKVYSNGEDCAVITAYAVDENGDFVPDADGIDVSFSTNGHGTILAVSNDDPTDHRRPTDTDAALWNGKCQLIVRSDDKPGPIILTARSSILTDAKVVIDRESASIRPFVESVPGCYISTVDVGDYFPLLDDIYKSDREGRINWTNKRFDKRLFTDMPVGFNVLPYRLKLAVPDRANALFFEHLVGRVHIQVIMSDGNVALDLRDDNALERYTLVLPQGIRGDVTVYVSCEIDPPTYHGPNPYWRFIGMYGIARWVQV